MIACHTEEFDRVMHFFDLPEPLTANKANSMHWSKRLDFTTAWKDTATYHAKGIKPKGDYIFRLCVGQILKKKAGRARDIDAIVPSLKAYVDGLILGGLAPDDSIKWYRGLCLHAPEMGEHSAVQIALYIRLPW